MCGNFVSLPCNEDHPYLSQFKSDLNECECIDSFRDCVGEVVRSPGVLFLDGDARDAFLNADFSLLGISKKKNSKGAPTW